MFDRFHFHKAADDVVPGGFIDKSSDKESRNAVVVYRGTAVRPYLNASGRVTVAALAAS